VLVRFLLASFRGPFMVNAGSLAFFPCSSLLGHYVFFYQLGRPAVPSKSKCPIRSSSFEKSFSWDSGLWFFYVAFPLRGFVTATDFPSRHNPSPPKPWLIGVPRTSSLQAPPPSVRSSAQIHLITFISSHSVFAPPLLTPIFCRMILFETLRDFLWHWVVQPCSTSTGV